MFSLTTERRGRARLCVTEPGGRNTQHVSPPCLAIAMSPRGLKLNDRVGVGLEPTPSHTTEHAVFRERRLNPAPLLY
jgi:hypothetical protein